MPEISIIPYIRMDLMLPLISSCLTVLVVINAVFSVSIGHDYNSSTQPTLPTSPMTQICNQTRYSVRTAAAFRSPTDFELQMACDNSYVV